MLAGLMKLPLEIAETIFRRLSDQKYFEIKSTLGEDYVFSLTASGRCLANERALTLRYAGPAPVSLKSWAATVRGQVADVDVTREKLRGAFSDIVITSEILDALGPALISRKGDISVRPQWHG